MTDTRSPLAEFQKLAAKPLGALLHHIVEQDAPGLVPPAVFEDAALIQRDLIVIAAFKRDLHDDGPLAALLSPRGRDALRSATVSAYLGPAGILARFAASHLQNPGDKLSTLLTVAEVQQTANTVPAEVPTIGIVLSSPSAALGPDGRALFDRDLVRAAVIVSSCLQVLIPDPDRRPAPLEPRLDPDRESLPRNAPRSHADASFDLGFAVRSTQQIAAALLSGRHALDNGIRSTLFGYLRLAERRLIRDGFSTFAGELSLFRQQAAGLGAAVPPRTLAVP